MVWDGDRHCGGFTDGTPWLPMARAHLPLSVAAQENTPKSLLHHYRRAIAFRHVHTALSRGGMQDMAAQGNVLRFIRKSADEQVFCAFNIGAEPAQLSMPPGDWHPVGAELNSAHEGADGVVHLGPWQPCLAVREHNAEGEDGGR